MNRVDFDDELDLALAENCRLIANNEGEEGIIESVVDRHEFIAV